MSINLPTLQALARPDEVRRIIGIYNQTLADYAEIQRRADSIAKGIASIGIIGGIRLGYRTTTNDLKTGSTSPIYEELKAKTWQALIQRTGLLDRVSSKRQEKMEKEIISTLSLPVTYENVLVVLEQIGKSWVAVHQELILDAFGHLTSNARNRVGRRGKYATNDAYAVGKKVILTRPATLNYAADQLHDIDKALCFLTGKTYTYAGSTVNCIDRVVRSSCEGESQFFTFRIYSETVHMTWKSEETRQRFNRLVAGLRPQTLPGEIKPR